MYDHTPTPWYSMSKPDDSQGTIAQEQTGKSVAVTYQGSADAHHIVRCVNEREELLEALRDAKENMYCRSATRQKWTGQDQRTYETLSKVLARAREEG